MWRLKQYPNRHIRGPSPNQPVLKPWGHWGAYRGVPAGVFEQYRAGLSRLQTRNDFLGQQLNLIRLIAVRDEDDAIQFGVGVTLELV